MTGRYRWLPYTWTLLCRHGGEPHVCLITREVSVCEGWAHGREVFPAGDLGDEVDWLPVAHMRTLMEGEEWL